MNDEYFRLAYQGFQPKNKLFNSLIEPDYSKNVGKINVADKILAVYPEISSPMRFMLIQKKSNSKKDTHHNRLGAGKEI